MRYLSMFVCCMEEFRAMACLVWPHNPLSTLQKEHFSKIIYMMVAWQRTLTNAANSLKIQYNKLRRCKKNVEKTVYCWFWMITCKKVCFVILGHYGCPEGFLRVSVFCWGPGSRKSFQTFIVTQRYQIRLGLEHLFHI